MILNMKSNTRKTAASTVASRVRRPVAKAGVAVRTIGSGTAAAAGALALANAAGTVDVGDPEAQRWIGRTVSKRSRRDAILRSVGVVLRGSGLSSLTMQDIAIELGITKGNLYYYFKDKQDILYQCHMRCMELSLDALRDVQAHHASMPDPLHTLLVRHIGGMLDTGFGSVMLTDLDNLSPAQRRHYVARRDQFEAGVRALIDAGTQRGIYACENVKLASLALLGAINWLPKWYRADGELSAAQVAAGLADFLMRALWNPQHPRPN